VQSPKIVCCLEWLLYPFVNFPLDVFVFQAQYDGFYYVHLNNKGITQYWISKKQFWQKKKINVLKIIV
jgi:hypothetical protein